MAQFTIEHLEALEYDFTGFPANSGGKCKGKGTIPEPTKQMLLDYAEAIRTMFSAENLSDLTDEEIANAAEKDLDERSDRLLEATSTLCSGTPTKDQLQDLPPRILRAFMKWVYREIADPEA